VAGPFSMINQVVAHYKILARLGDSELSEVYLAEDLELSRQVAIKFLAYPYAASADFRERFKQEAQAAALINHPNSITIYEVGEFAGQPYIVMEYVAGESLRQMLARRELAIDEILDIMLQLGAGLRSAHEQGVWHRDLKPENILLDRAGHVKITDFGLAKLRKVNRKTLPGTVLGTPAYMSPEQVLGEEVDQRADIFSFGVMLYEMVARQMPFRGETWEAISHALLHRQPEPLARYKNEVSTTLQNLVDKALDKDRETRYQHIDDLMADLKREKKRLTVSSSTNPAKKKRIGKSWRWAGGFAALAVAFFLIGKFSLFTNESNGRPQTQLSSPRDSAEVSDGKAIETPALPPLPFKSDSPKTKPAAPVSRETLPVFGSLFIDSQPADAEIFLDNRLAGRTPRRLTNLPAGVYTLILRQQDYQDLSLTAELKAGETKNLNLPMTARSGRVRILLLPGGTIFINGALQKEEVADWHEMALAAGIHQLKLIGPNGARHERTLAIAPDTALEIKFDFTQTATLTVTAKDEMSAVLHNAAIYLDGQATGKTAPRQFTVPVGYHTVTVRLDGYELIGNEQSLDLEAGQKQILNFILRKVPE